MATAHFQSHQHIPSYADDAIRIWSLIDSPVREDPIPSNLADGAMELFYIAALPPEVERYHEAAKQPVRMWWMSPWTEDELLAL